jgi:chemotaxis family two-component system response regulator Rcp1
MSVQEEILTIMILEDNRADVHLLKEALRQAGMKFQAIVFADGESAFRYIDGGPGFESIPRPDAAILDLNVPKRNGSEVLSHIRAHPGLQEIPVIILSSSPQQVMRDQAAQADCYITKPSDLAKFLAIGPVIGDCVQTARAKSENSCSRIMELASYGGERQIGGNPGQRVFETFVDFHSK